MKRVLPEAKLHKREGDAGLRACSQGGIPFPFVRAPALFTRTSVFQKESAKVLCKQSSIQSYPHNQHSSMPPQPKNPFPLQRGVSRCFRQRRCSPRPCNPHPQKGMEKSVHVRVKRVLPEAKLHKREGDAGLRACSQGGIPFAFVRALALFTRTSVFQKRSRKSLFQEAAKRYE